MDMPPDLRTILLESKFKEDIAENIADTFGTVDMLISFEDDDFGEYIQEEFSDMKSFKKKILKIRLINLKKKLILQKKEQSEKKLRDNLTEEAKEFKEDLEDEDIPETLSFQIVLKFKDYEDIRKSLTTGWEKFKKKMQTLNLEISKPLLEIFFFKIESLLKDNPNGIKRIRDPNKVLKKETMKLLKNDELKVQNKLKDFKKREIKDSQLMELKTLIPEEGEIFKNVDFNKKISMEEAKLILDKKLELIRTDYEYINRKNTQINDMVTKISNGKLLKGWAFDDDMEIHQDVSELLVKPKGFETSLETETEIREEKYFTTKERFESFKESYQSLGYLEGSLLGTDSKEIKVKRSFNHTQEMKNLENVFSSDEVSNLVKSNLLIFQMQNLEFNFSSIELSKNAIADLTKLAGIEMNSLKFETDLENFFTKFGCLFNLGNITLGGSLVTSTIFKAETEMNLSHIQEVLIDRSTSAMIEGYNVPILLAGMPKNYDPKGGNEEQESKRAINDNTNIEHFQVGGPKAVTNRKSFENCVRFDNHDWSIIKAKLDLVFVGDLIISKINRRKLKENNVSIEEIRQLQKKMWDHFKDNYSKKINSVILSPEMIFEEGEEANEIIKIEKIMEKFWEDTGKKKVIQFLEEIVKYQLSCKNSNEMSYIWHQFKINSPKSIPIMVHIIEEIEKYSEKEDELKLLNSLFSVWEALPEDLYKIPDYKNIKKRLFYLERSKNELVKKKRSRLKKESKDRRFFSVELQGLDDLKEYYKEMMKFAVNYKKEDLKSYLNEGLPRLIRLRGKKRHYAQLVAHDFCLVKHFQISLEKLMIHQILTIGNFEEFLEYLENNFEQISEEINKKIKEDESERFTKDKFKGKLDTNKFSKFWEEKFKNEGIDEESRKKFIKHLSEMDDDKLSVQIENKYLIPANVEITGNELETVKEEIINLLDILDNINKASAENPKSEWVLEKTKYRKECIKLCNNDMSVLRIEDVMGVNLRKIITKLYDNKEVWKEVLGQILAKNNCIKKISIDFQKTDIKKTPVDYLRAIYALSDYNMRRIIAMNMLSTQTPLPLIFPDCHSYLAPLAAAHMLYEDIQGSSVRLNPFFHRSVKISFFQTKQNKFTAEFLANKVFFSNNEVFVKESPGYTGVDGFFFTNKTSHLSSIQKYLSDLYCLMMVKEPFQKISIIQEFVLQISNVVFFVRDDSEEDQKKFEIMFKIVSSLNEFTESKIIFFDMLQSSGKEKIERGNFNHLGWYIQFPLEYELETKRIHIKFASLSQKYINAKEAESIEKISRGSKFRGIKFDTQEKEFSEILRKIEDLVGCVKRLVKDNKRILNGQDTLLKEHSENLSTLVHMKLDKNISQKKNILKKHLFTIRREQLNSLIESANHKERSPFWIFVDHLFSLTPSQSIGYLFYLENFLAHYNLKNIFEADPTQPLEVINFFREMGQLYEAVADLSDNYPRDDQVIDEMANISVMTKMMSQIFKVGYPLEILNGDLDVICTRWLKGILRQLYDIKDFNLEIKVMSVLGMQGSGKSTFLNSMFNVNFPAKEQRCTRGSTAQLLPIRNKENSKLAKYSGTEDIVEYIMIIDTEGLGSPEKYASMLNKKRPFELMKRRNNKIALLNAGLADLCIINTRGTFDIRLFNILTMLIFSFVRLEESHVNPIMDMVYQIRNHNTKQIEKEKMNTVDALENKYKIMNQDLQSKKKFDEILRFVEGKEVFFIPVNTNFSNYTFSYMEYIEKYKNRIFSKEFIGDKNISVHLDGFIEKLENLDNMITLENYNFDFNSFKEKKKMEVVFQFRLKIRKEIRIKLDQIIGEDLEKFNSMPESLREKMEEIAFGHLDEATQIGFRSMGIGEELYNYKTKDDVRLEMDHKLKNLQKSQMFKELEKEQNLEMFLEEILETMSGKLEEILQKSENLKLSDEQLKKKFDEIFKNYESQIKDIDKKMRKCVLDINQFEEHCIDVLNSIKKSVLEMVFALFKQDVNDESLVYIRKYLESKNFEIFPRGINTQESPFDYYKFQSNHKILITSIKKKADTEKPYNSSLEIINSSALDDLVKDVLSKIGETELEMFKKNKNQEKVSSKSGNLKDVQRQYSRADYFLDLIIFGVDYYYWKSKSKVDKYLQKINYAGEFHRNYYDYLLTSYKNQYKGLANGEKLFNILQIVGKKIVINAADTHLDRLFEMKVNQEMKIFVTREDIIKLIQIEFVKESRRNNLLSGTEKERLNTELLLKVLHFGFNLKDDVLSFVENRIERCKNKSSFTIEMYSMIREKYSSSMGEIKDLVLSSSLSLEEVTKTLNDYLGDNEVAKLQLKGFLNNLKSSGKRQSNVMMKGSGMEAVMIDKLKELFHRKEKFDIDNDLVNQMFDEVNILNEDNVKENYKAKYEFCGEVCNICSVPCTESKGHEKNKVPHSTNYHVSNTLSGITYFIYIYYIQPIMLSLLLIIYRYLLR